MNKTTTKKASTKTANRTSKAVYGQTSVYNNVGRLNNGMYRARKCVDGVKYSRNFKSARDAKAWVNSL